MIAQVTLKEAMRRHRTWLSLALATIVVGGLYLALAAVLAGQVASNVTVNGIAIGGMSPREATVTLDRALATKASRPVRLTVPPRSVDIKPGVAGLQVDVAATVAGLTGFTVNPLQMWVHLTGAETHPLVYRIDRAKLTAAVSKAAKTLSHPKKEGSITFTGGTAKVVPPVTGARVMIPETTEAVAAAWPQRQVVQAVTAATRPKVSEDEVKRAAAEFAVPAMSAPVKVVAGSPAVATITLQPGQYARALSVTPDGKGKLQLRVSRPALMAAIRSAAPGVESTPVDATVRLVAGQAQVVPAGSGTRFDERTAPARFRAALTSRKRTARITIVAALPKVTTATARGWGINEAISTFTTQFPVNPPRTNNIEIAVARLNGTLVRPGEQFSLNATLGQRTSAKGYQKAPVIYGGRLVKDYGGGVSQVSTTTFNAAFFGGVRIDQYTPHSFYIARYPEGREATVSWPDVDQKWTNNTGFGILIKASASGGDLTVTFLGTKTLDVEAVKGPRRNLVKPKKIVDARADCVPQSPVPGFDVTVSRIFKKNGAVVQTSRLNTHYIPENEVRCTHPAAD